MAELGRIIAGEGDAALSSWREGLSIPRRSVSWLPGLRTRRRWLPSNLPIGRPDSGFIALQACSRRLAADDGGAAFPGYSGASASALHRFPWRFPRAARVATSRVLVMRLYIGEYSERRRKPSSRAVRGWSRCEEGRGHINGRRTALRGHTCPCCAAAGRRASAAFKPPWRARLSRPRAPPAQPPLIPPGSSGSPRASRQASANASSWVSAQPAA